MHCERRENKFLAQNRWHRWCLLGILLLAGIGVYWNSLPNDFLLDDFYVVKNNVFIRNLDNLPSLFGPDYFQRAQEMTYRPVPTAFLMLEYRLFGSKAEGFRAMSVGWHLGAALLLFGLLVRLLSPWLGRVRSRNVAFWTSLLFVVHPVHTEAINVISYHEDLLCMLFYLASFHFYLNHLNCQKRLARAGHLVLASFTFLLALYSKEMAVTLPLVLALYHLLLDPARKGKPHLLRLLKSSWLVFAGMAAMFTFVQLALLKPSGFIMEVGPSDFEHWTGFGDLLT